MGEKRTANRTAAYLMSKDMRSQERKAKEQKALAKKSRKRDQKPNQD